MRTLLRGALGRKSQWPSRYASHRPGSKNISFDELGKRGGFGTVQQDSVLCEVESTRIGSVRRMRVGGMRGWPGPSCEAEDATVAGGGGVCRDPRVVRGLGVVRAA